MSTRHRLGAVLDVGLRREAVSPHRTDQLPASVPVPSDVAWRMDDNNTIGDCTIAGVDHMVAAWNGAFRLSLPRMSQQQVEQAYFHLTGGADTGLPEAKVLEAWSDSTIFETQIPAFEQVATDAESVQAVIADYRAAYLGVALPESAEAQFADGLPWFVDASPIAGGHCVVAVGYDPLYLYVATWGRVQRATWDWWRTYGFQAWMVQPPRPTLL